MLEVQQLAVSYRGLVGIQDVSFTVSPGELVGIMGPNGAGKSTMLKAILGITPVTAGRIDYCTCPLCRQRERVAYLPQRSQVDWDFPITVQNVVMMSRVRRIGWFRRPSKMDCYQVQLALEKVEMWDLRQRRIGELSGGQQQRVFLARAIAQEADVFLLDEPFTGIDKKTEGIICDIFAELKALNKILLVSSHDWSGAIDRVDRLLLLNQRLIAAGTPSEVLTPENIHHAYGVNLPETHHHSFDSELFC